MAEIAAWHVHFDGDSAVALHVCELHRAIGQSLTCPDADPATGDCANAPVRVLVAADLRRMRVWLKPHANIRISIILRIIGPRRGSS